MVFLGLAKGCVVAYGAGSSKSNTPFYKKGYREQYVLRDDPLRFVTAMQVRDEMTRLYWQMKLGRVSVELFEVLARHLRYIHDMFIKAEGAERQRQIEERINQLKAIIAGMANPELLKQIPAWLKDQPATAVIEALPEVPDIPDGELPLLDLD
jgi:hypothetical protein